MSTSSGSSWLCFLLSGSGGFLLLTFNEASLGFGAWNFLNGGGPVKPADDPAHTHQPHMLRATSTRWLGRNSSWNRTQNRSWWLSLAYGTGQFTRIDGDAGTRRGGAHRRGGGHGRRSLPVQPGSIGHRGASDAHHRAARSRSWLWCMCCLDERWRSYAAAVGMF